MDREMMESMVADFLFDAGEELADLELDGEPYYDPVLEMWRQDAYDSTTSYALVNRGGEITLHYMGSL